MVHGHMQEPTSHLDTNVYGLLACMACGILGSAASVFSSNGGERQPWESLNLAKSVSDLEDQHTMDWSVRPLWVVRVVVGDLGSSEGPLRPRAVGGSLRNEWQWLWWQ